MATSRLNPSKSFPLVVCFRSLTCCHPSGDEAAADPRIDGLRAKTTCVEDATFSADYHHPDKRSIGNAITLTLKDGTVLDEVSIEYHVGHKRRRTEGTPLLMQKF